MKFVALVLSSIAAVSVDKDIYPVPYSVPDDLERYIKNKKYRYVEPSPGRIIDDCSKPRSNFSSYTVTDGCYRGYQRKRGEPKDWRNDDDESCYPWCKKARTLADVPSVYQ